MNINEQVAAKVLETIDSGLVKGMGEPVPGEMCVEAAVCYALGLPHGDDPGCVSAALRELKIGLNDSEWSSNQARAKGLRRLGIAQLGTKHQLNDVVFARRVVLMLFNTTLADYLNAVGDLVAASACRNATDLAAAKAVYGLNRSSPVSWAYDAALAATEPERHARARATYRVVISVQRALAATTGDQVLVDFAERVVQILIDMKAPGTQWLYLTETK